LKRRDRLCLIILSLYEREISFNFSQRFVSTSLGEFFEFLQKKEVSLKKEVSEICFDFFQRLHSTCRRVFCQLASEISSNFSTRFQSISLRHFIRRVGETSFNFSHSFHSISLTDFIQLLSEICFNFSQRLLSVSLSVVCQLP